MTDDEADMYYDRWIVAKNRIKQLEDGIMDMKQTIADKDKIIDDLKATMRDAMFQINCEDPWQAYEILEEAVEK